MKNNLGKKTERVLSIDPEGFLITLRYVGGQKIKISLSQIFSHPKALAAEILKGNLFSNCFIENGALAWPNGFELCPDMLYGLASKSKSPRTAAA